MILCSCNVFTDKQVRDALEGRCPPKTAREVYAALGCAPKCGCCARSITELLQEQAERATAKPTVDAKRVDDAA